jgi:hypothetical protein
MSQTFAGAAVSCLALCGLAGVSVGAPTLNATMTVDNQFVASVSTSPTAPGTTFLTGNSWPTTSVGSFVFPGTGTYYLHVLATDLGRPEMFIGLFTITDPQGSTFANGGTQLVTNTTHWTVSNTSFGVNAVAPLDLGANGTSPWGNFSAMTSSARFLWAPTYTSTVYFTTVINVVPTPTVTAGLAIGLLASTRRRR